jgi:hypothetical protein
MTSEPFSKRLSAALKAEARKRTVVVSEHMVALFAAVVAHYRPSIGPVATKLGSASAIWPTSAITT